MGRAPCCDKANVKKGPWSPEEDSKLKEYIEKFGTGGNWIALPQKAAAQLPGRTDNDIKNYWNTKLRKKLMAMASQSQRKPLPFPSPHHHQSPPLSYQSLLSIYNDSSAAAYPCCPAATAKPFSTGFEPISPIPSNILANNSSTLATNPSSLFQTQEGWSPLQYHHPVKENNNTNNNNGSNLLVFGSEASCSSNSDGSCSQISYGGGREIKQEDMGFQGYISNGYEKNHKFMLSYGNNSVNGSGNLNQWAEKATGYFGETPPLEYDLEDVKQLISSSSNNSCNNNFLIDENKTQERFMYYY
ncbi:hypothetical protein GH714_015003 [Hevea brasiliensis]|uniref:Uncharacterized protein n=1 Tax=Hevea brasiliensis TaxID=3981 RepID=A0A6A6LM10_HEVBR|nr:hypothetical protein GH714_015003 [Hevea brasiliensis]